MASGLGGQDGGSCSVRDEEKMAFLGPEVEVKMIYS